MDQGSFRLTISGRKQKVKVGQKDYRPNIPCACCGILDATVSRVDHKDTPLCKDCSELGDI